MKNGFFNKIFIFELVNIMCLLYMKRELDSLNYSIVKSSRKTISIIVHPDGKVVVRAPKKATDRQVKEVLYRRLEWILKHRKKFEEQQLLNPKRMFVSGERHLFLGVQYVLRINNLTQNRKVSDTVYKEGDFIDIWCNDTSDAEKLMQLWYLSAAKELFPGIITPIVNRFREIYNVSPNKITIKKMKSRWGSCSSKGSISLNSKLIQAPVSCIEYVIVHELCHLMHFNHSKNFYSLLAEVIPDWKERKKLLRTILPYGCSAN